eukprot:CAMPEP_0170756758 /NCGR_PEP_ID=MMETSP0437-20130122/14186_1 /TAXON_ID=0 /ORGANISM="Sexangularia sp." /LENGTH=528 /DNA_ID=CAMNT_0011095943 /DNA_START=104 /DNA_END=1692 /DNA_ORIENTATION=+
MTKNGKEESGGIRLHNKKSGVQLMLLPFGSGSGATPQAGKKYQTHTAMKIVPDKASVSLNAATAAAVAAGWKVVDHEAELANGPDEIQFFFAALQLDSSSVALVDLDGNVIVLHVDASRKKKKKGGPSVPTRTDITSGEHSATGRRESNEDFHLIVPGLDLYPDMALFAVFDGHGGAGASKFCARKMQPVLEKTKELKEGKVGEALISAYKKVDEKYMDKFEEDGTTAVVAVLSADNTLTVANVGDSRCYIVPPAGPPIAMSQDHKPSDPKERKRIEEAGHEVVRDTILQHGKRVHTHRVDGILAVARSIGDGNFKDSFEAPPEEQAVCCVPDIATSEKPVEPGSFLLLACDGLWDVVTGEEAADMVRARVAEGMTLDQVAESLSTMAIDERGSDDNVTIVLAQVGKAPWSVTAPDRLQPEIVGSSSPRSKTAAAQKALQCALSMKGGKAEWRYCVEQGGVSLAIGNVNGDAVVGQRRSLSFQPTARRSCRLGRYRKRQRVIERYLTRVTRVCSAFMTDGTSQQRRIE